MLAVPRMMEAVRLHAPGVDGLRHETIDTPSLKLGEALVEVHAAAITRDELEWPLDRLPAVPSYELSGVVAAVADNVDVVSVGDDVYALTPFDATVWPPSTLPSLRLRSPRSRPRSAISKAPRSRCRR